MTDIADGPRQNIFNNCGLMSGHKGHGVKVDLEHVSRAAV